MKPLDERSYAFVVRVWEERRDLDGAPATWRCSIDDVQRGTRAYFSSISHACVFMLAHAGIEQSAVEVEEEDGGVDCVAREQRPIRKRR